MVGNASIILSFHLFFNLLIAAHLWINRFSFFRYHTEILLVEIVDRRSWLICLVALHAVLFWNLEDSPWQLAIFFSVIKVRRSWLIRLGAQHVAWSFEEAFLLQKVIILPLIEYWIRWLIRLGAQHVAWSFYYFFLWTQSHFSVYIAQVDALIILIVRECLI